MVLVTDPIADLLARIKNALARRKEQVTIPHSKVKEAIAEVLKKQGFIEDFEVNETEGRKQLVVTLKYDEFAASVIGGITRVSRPGQRIYSPAKKIHPVLSGLGVAVVSTSQGIMTDDEARKQNIGGEILFKIW